MAQAYSTKILSNGIHALIAPIICLPGWPQTASAFLDMLPILSQSHHVLILDPPGLGHSAAPASSYDTASIANLLSSATSAELGASKKYHLIGHDVGAWIAYAWATQTPHHTLLLSLILIDGLVPGLTAPMPFPLPEAANLKLFQFAFNRLPDLPEILTQGKEREFLDWLFDNKAVHPGRITRERRDGYVAAYRNPGAMGRGFAYYRAVGESSRLNKEVASRGGKLDVPLLAIGGENGAGEAIKGVLDIANKEGESAALSRFVLVRDCGHYVMEEQPNVTAGEILGFIGEVERKKAT